MARWIDSWLPDAESARTGSAAEGHPGERFGLPATGVGSSAGFGRRLAALTIDWLAGYLIASLVASPDPVADPGFGWVVMGVWLLLTAVPVAVFGASAGMTALGIRVAPLIGMSS